MFIYLQKNLHVWLQFGLHKLFTVISLQELNWYICMCNLEVTHWFLLFLLHNKIFRTLQTFIFTWQSFLLCETDVLMGQKCCCAQDMSSHLGNDFAFFMFLNCGRPLRTWSWAEMCTINKTTPSSFVTVVIMPWVYPETAWHNIISYWHLGIFYDTA